MNVIAKDKRKIDCYTYTNVSSITFNSETNIYTLTYTGGTVTLSKNNYWIIICE